MSTRRPPAIATGRDVPREIAQPWTQALVNSSRSRTATSSGRPPIHARRQPRPLDADPAEAPGDIEAGMQTLSESTHSTGLISPAAARSATLVKWPPADSGVETE